MKRDETVYLRHILDAIARIEEYLQGIDGRAFKQRHLIQDGVIRQLEVIGEAVKIFRLKSVTNTSISPGRI
jgi:uncharacterized protein with HEPN domain